MNEQAYKVQDIGRLYEMLDNYDAGAAKSDNVYGFLGKASPLSNFYLAPFDHNGSRFSCVEMALQSYKMEYAGRIDISNAIKKMEDPLTMKREAEKVHCPNWYNSGECDRYLKSILKSKFTQCMIPKKCLLGTGERSLAEANPSDAYFGVGLAKSDPKIKDPSKWKGKNKMGVFLEELRSCLREQSD